MMEYDEPEPNSQPLMAMVTSDADSATSDRHEALVDDVRFSRGASDKEALAYLLKYETMVRQQEVEDMATLAHVRPLLARLRMLGGEAGGKSHSHSDQSDINDLTTEISFATMRRALAALEWPAFAGATQ